ncbi:MAG: Wzz/FepE/Etk N-terminal domain-containing protein [candidate division Zixibacteria bacterium]|nr:Wzz/FepE/Etk N-terminal domain-containing protein [candidate division Zixibacteria bacterium]
MSKPETSNFLLFLELLARKRALILGIVLICTAIAVVVSFVLPKWYEAKALLLPPKDVSFVSSNLSYLAETSSLTKGLDLPMMVTPSDVYARMLKSRTIATQIIKQFDLTNRFKSDNLSEAYETLMDKTDFRVTDEGLLKVSFQDKDPEFAAKVTNSFVKELEKVNEEIKTSRVRQSRIFIEDRLESVKATLDSARKEFQQFQLINKAIDFDEQTKLAFNQAVGLKVRLAELDISVKLNKEKLGSDNSKLQELLKKRKTVKEQLQELEHKNPDSSFFSLPISSIPSLRGKYEVLYSRVRVNESLYKILLEQYEQVKFQEQEYASTITVLDWATPPDIRVSPKRTLIVVSTFALSLIMAIFLAAFAEYLTRLKKTSPDDYRRLEMFAKAYLSWLPGIKRSHRT